jgi:hypothetical protein
VGDRFFASQNCEGACEIAKITITHIEIEKWHFSLILHTRDNLVFAFETKVMVPARRYSFFNQYRSNRKHPLANVRMIRFMSEGLITQALDVLGQGGSFGTSPVRQIDNEAVPESDS